MVQKYNNKKNNDYEKVTYVIGLLVYIANHG